MDALWAQLALLLATVALTVSLNLSAGKAGIWSVGHLGFFGIGAFVTAAAMEAMGPTWWGVSVAVAAALAAAAIFGFAIGITTLRLQQDFFVVMSIAFLELVRNGVIAIAGPEGFRGIPLPAALAAGASGTWLAPWLVLGPVAVACIFIARRIESLPLDRVFALVRRSEDLATATGRSPMYVKLGAFLLASMMASAAGSGYTLWAGGTDPAQLLLSRNLMLFAVVILGGVDSVLGSIFGAVVLVSVPRLIEAAILASPQSSALAAQLTQLLMGIVLIVFIKRMPSGAIESAGSTH